MVQTRSSLLMRKGSYTDPLGRRKSKRFNPLAERVSSLDFQTQLRSPRSDDDFVISTEIKIDDDHLKSVNGSYTDPMGCRKSKRFRDGTMSDSSSDVGAVSSRLRSKTELKDVTVEACNKKNVSDDVQLTEAKVGEDARERDYLKSVDDKSNRVNTMEMVKDRNPPMETMAAGSKCKQSIIDTKILRGRMVTVIRDFPTNMWSKISNSGETAKVDVLKEEETVKDRNVIDDEDCVILSEAKVGQDAASKAVDEKVCVGVTKGAESNRDSTPKKVKDRNPPEDATTESKCKKSIIGTKLLRRRTVTVVRDFPTNMKRKFSNSGETAKVDILTEAEKSVVQKLKSDQSPNTRSKLSNCCATIQVDVAMDEEISVVEKLKSGQSPNTRSKLSNCGETAKVDISMKEENSVVEKLKSDQSPITRSKFSNSIEIAKVDISMIAENLVVEKLKSDQSPHTRSKFSNSGETVKVDIWMEAGKMSKSGHSPEALEPSVLEKSKVTIPISNADLPKSTKSKLSNSQNNAKVDTKAETSAVQMSKSDQSPEVLEPLELEKSSGTVPISTEEENLVVENLKSGQSPKALEPLEIEMLLVPISMEEEKSKYVQSPKAFEPMKLEKSSLVTVPISVEEENLLVEKLKSGQSPKGLEPLKAKVTIPISNEDAFRRITRGRIASPSPLKVSKETNKETLVACKATGPNTEDSDRCKVKETLRLFRETCGKIMQDEGAKLGKRSGNNFRVDYEAANILKKEGKSLNTGTPLRGDIPGVEIGDEFQYRAELNLLGIHRLNQAGIDYMKDEKEEIFATSIVSNGGDDRELDNSNVLIYNGQGGYVKKGKKNGKKCTEPVDQQLVKGNLALANSKLKKNPVRVIKGVEKTTSDSSAKSYVYDGLYLVEDYWKETAPSHGKVVYKFRLRRVPGQPKLKKPTILKKSNESAVSGSLCNVDISEGKERLPICAVNDIDGEEPPMFDYTVKMIYPDWCMPIPPRGCGCTKPCSVSQKCSCIVKNDGELPYNANGDIFWAKPFVYECGPLCKCPPSCYLRATQHGIKIQLEIFKTESRGWGVRSRKLIPSGSFICEYAGQLLEDNEAETFVGEDEYLFDIGKDREISGFTIDAAKKGNIGRFINHSCSPNMYPQNVLYDHDDKRIAHIMFFASADIAPLEELTYDYNYVIDQVMDAKGNIKKKYCYCGSSECTGRLY